MKDIVDQLKEAALSGEYPLGRSFEYLRLAEVIEQLREENIYLRNRLEQARQQLSNS